VPLDKRILHAQYVKLEKYIIAKLKFEAIDGGNEKVRKKCGL
jgi:hypothetical protein